MDNTLITYLQIFGIGFSFGMAGPCFLACTPVLVAYITGSKNTWKEVFKDVFVFLSGRFLAYMLLGALAGLSGAVLRKFTSSGISPYLRPLAGVATILFAIIILANKNNNECACRTVHGKIYNYTGILAFGFLIGVSPCAPLLALLFNITLMSKSALDGMAYAFFFGAGTFLSGLITVGAIAGIAARSSAAFIKSKAAKTIFRIACSFMLIALGIGLIATR
jgi:sulfite exporter TauE/SafE